MTSNSVLPKELLIRLQNLLWDDLESVLQAFSTERIASFRVNTLRSTEFEVEAFLTREKFPIVRVDGFEGVYLLPRVDEYRFKGLDLFRSGKIYMQSLSSMIPALLVTPRAGMQILDVCAAPGSKTTQIAALTKNTAQIVALEQSPVRFEKLVHNLTLQGATSVEAIRSEAIKYLKSTEIEFDAIFLDVPCSAEWRIRLSDEKTYGFWSVENIHRKAIIQTELLTAALSRLKVWGRLVYSTCTLAPEENESVIQAVARGPIPFSLQTISLPSCYQSAIRSGRTDLSGDASEPGPFVSQIDLSKTVRILPSEMMEGFFVAVLQRGE